MIPDKDLPKCGEDALRGWRGRGRGKEAGGSVWTGMLLGSHEPHEAYVSVQISSPLLHRVLLKDVQKK